MSQNFSDFSATENLDVSQPKIVNNDKTIMSCSSGILFPTTDNEVGRLCFRTDLGKLYQLTSLSPVTWSQIPLGVPVSISQGGTGATDSGNARTNLGLGALATKSSIAAGDIANDAVTTVKILNGNVTNAKIADGAVNNAKLAAGAVFGDRIADAGVADGKLASAFVKQGYHTIWVPVGAMFDNPSSIPPGALTFQYNTTYGAFFPCRAFSGATTQQLGVPIIRPRSAIGGLMRMRFYGWGAATGGNISFYLNCFRFAPGDLVNATTGVNGSILTATQAAGAVAALVVSGWSNAAVLTGDVDGCFPAGRLVRDAATDTNTGTFNLIGIEIQYEVKAFNDA